MRFEREGTTMSLVFYPHSDDMQAGSLHERLEILAEAAERYKAFVLDALSSAEPTMKKKTVLPKDQKAAYNWEEIARILREIRELSEMEKRDKERKAACLRKLAEIYETLRSAKMPKLEAVRLALISEANQLAGQSSQVA
jgi:hypothetical protein